MDEAEAREILAEQIERLRKLSYEELRGRVQQGRRFLGVEFTWGGEADTAELTGPSGACYQLETQVLWDDRRSGNLRVIVAIDDGGPSALKPTTDGFILAPDGSFVG